MSRTRTEVFIDKAVFNPLFEDPLWVARLMRRTLPPLEDAGWLFVRCANSDLRETLKVCEKARVLTKAEEELLFKRMNYHRWLALQGDAKQIEPALHFRNQIVNYNLPLVFMVLQKFKKLHVQFSEAVQEGAMAVMRAATLFNTGRGFKFSTYAHQAIHTAFIRMVTKKLPLPGYEGDEEQTDHGELREVEVTTRWIEGVKDALKLEGLLTRLERRILRYRFGVFNNSEGMTLQEVGARLGLTRERIRQIQHEALNKIRVVLDNVVEEV